MGTAGTHSGKQRTISVGILSAEWVEFVLDDGRVLTAGEQDGRVVIDGEARDEWYFAGSAGGFFTLKNVQIGKGFHWQRYQDQSFPGDLKLIARDGCVIAINVVGIEDYLQCVIASEMSPSAGFEFLKAHSVISRSWLLAQLDKRDEVREGYSSVECDTTDELIRWQDREDHEWFDFCADDHCQRYQGIPQGNPAMVRKTKRVIEATWGQVLWYDGRVCDARFSKCCGGALEEFKYCWEDKEVPYLKYARDYEPISCGGRLNAGRQYSTPLPAVGYMPPEEGAWGRRAKRTQPAIAGSIAAAGASMDLTVDKTGRASIDLREESAARKWILSHPRAFCNTHSKRLLGQVLKDYDSETKDFYRWTVEYTAKELHDIILERTGEDYGEIRDLIPLERGVSGRICRLKIVGTKKTKIIGKELEIRKTLSRSHLYSSAFVVEKVYGPQRSDYKSPEGDSEARAVLEGELASAERRGVGAEPHYYRLHGAGWGHGVGLCQIGAAAMGARGYDYRTILQHYYPGSEIHGLYPLSRRQREASCDVLVAAKPRKTK